MLRILKTILCQFSIENIPYKTEKNISPKESQSTLEDARALVLHRYTATPLQVR